MFDFNNVNKVIDGKSMVDTTIVTQLSNETIRDIMETTGKLNMSEKMNGILKNIISKMGVIKTVNNEPIVVNAICFFNSPVKGIGALLNDPEFRIYELDVSNTNIVLTNYVAGGIITRSRDIDAYNKSRQFHKDDIMCIIPVNNRGVEEYSSTTQYITNIININHNENELDTILDEAESI